MRKHRDGITVDTSGFIIIWVKSHANTNIANTHFVHKFRHVVHEKIHTDEKRGGCQKAFTLYTACIKDVKTLAEVKLFTKYSSKLRTKKCSLKIYDEMIHVKDKFLNLIKRLTVLERFTQRKNIRFLSKRCVIASIIFFCMSLCAECLYISFIFFCYILVPEQSLSPTLDHHPR